MKDELLWRQCWANSQYSRQEYLKNTGILCLASDKNVEEVVGKAITKARVGINVSDIKDCHCVGKKGKP